MIPNKDLMEELQTDPANMGYAGASSSDDGFKSTRELLQLLGMRRLIPNPSPPAKIFKPLEISELFTLVPTSELAAMDFDLVSRVRTLVEQKDIPGLQLLIQWMAVRGASGETTNQLSTSTVAVIQARLNSALPENQIDDPDHPTEVYDDSTPRTNVRWGKSENPDVTQINNLLRR